MTSILMTGRRVAVAAVLLAGAAALAAPSGAGAQGVRPDARWAGWLGCWQPVDASTADSYTAWMEQRARDAGAPVLCIVPSTSATAVDFVTVIKGKVTVTETVDAADSHLTRERDGCQGWEGASWSTDARRVYLRSDYACGQGVTRASSGMLALTGTGELLQIEEIASGGAKSVHVSRYQSIPAPAGFALDSALVPRADAVPVTAARAAMAAPLTGADIVDAVQNVDSLVVEAWLVERGDRFTVDAKRLAALADAGVPGRITDLMVALAYPQVFALDRTARVASALPPAGTGRTLLVTVPRADPFGYGYGYGYSPFGYSPFYYGDYGYGLGGYGGYGYGYLYRPPIVIVRGGGSNGSGRAHGRVVKGYGYTRDPNASNGASGSVGSRRGSGNTGSSSSGSTTSSGTSSSSGSTAGTSSSSGETRQAKPRP